MIAYHILQHGQPYNELGGDYFIERQNKDAYQRRLVKQLERMGANPNLDFKMPADELRAGNVAPVFAAVRDLAQR